MPYPTISRYHSAIRHPKLAFRKKDPVTKVEQDLDPILVAGKPVEITNSQGVKDLWSAAGGCACVFKYESFSPKKLWAVRCFLKSTSTVASHYKKVSSRIKSITCSSYFVEFTFLDEGIRVDGNLYPIVRMEWVEGKNLKTFIRDNLSNKSKLDSLAKAWVQLSKDLLDAGIAHGDLHHDNILVDDSNGITLKLIDYDSLYFSIDGNTIDDEHEGLLGYQHPLRKSLKKQCIEIDFFPQLVIYISILALAENKQLWNTYNLDNTERLLFDSADFPNLDQAQIFKDLSQFSSDVSKLADELKKIGKLTDFSQIPSLYTVLSRVTPKPVDATKVFINVKQNINSHVTQAPSTTIQPPNSVTGTGGIPWGNKVSSSTPIQKFPPTAPQPTPTTIQPSTSAPVTQAPSTTIQQQNTTSVSGATVLVRAIAIVSTITAVAFGGFCYYQYQEINQLKQRIEDFRQRTNTNIQTLQEKRDDLQSQVNKLEEQVRRFKTERDKLQSRVNELEKYTYVNFCNKTNSKVINAAFTYWDGKGLRSKGWWVVEPGKCREVSVGSNYRGNLYTYGMYNRGERNWDSGSSSFCVDIINAFDIPNSDKDSCSGDNLRRVTMSELFVYPGTNTWSFNG